MLPYVKEYKEKGYTIVRNFLPTGEIAKLSQAFDTIKSEGLKHPASFRHQNLLYLIQPDENLGKVLRFCHWPCYINEALEAYRTSQAMLDILKPLIGDNLKSITNQLIWKTPGAKQSSYGYHQDSRFRRPASAYRDMYNSVVQTSLSIDANTVENGCLTFIESSHLQGEINYHTDKSIFQENISDQVLSELSFDKLPKVKMVTEPGDLILWNPYLLHGSNHNISSGDRRSYTNAYGIAKNCDRGEWAFKNGKAIKVSEPVLIQYDDLYTRPEPHYIDGPPHPFKKER